MDLRQYDPAMGRWVVQDPVIHHDYSPYSAFDNNPVYWSDPSGADSQLYKDKNGNVVAGSFDGQDALNLFNQYLNSSSKKSEEEVQKMYEFTTSEENDGNGGGGDGTEDNIHINTKSKTVQVEKTGDDFDRIFVDGKEVLATTRGLLGAELRQAGYDISTIGPQGVGMGLTDLVLDVFNIISGGMLIKKGVTIIPKSSLGLKVGLGGSAGTLESSVYFTRTLGINSKMPFRLPTIMGVPTNNTGVFLGRNSALFGTMQAGGGIYGRKK